LNLEVLIFLTNNFQKSHESTYKFFRFFDHFYFARVGQAQLLSVSWYVKNNVTGFDAYTSKFNLAADTVISVNMKPQNMSVNNVVAGNKLKKDSTKPQKNRNQFENENK
jgi:hypothetical protein